MKASLLIATISLAAISASQEGPRKITLAEAIRLAQQNSPVVGAAKSDLDAANAGARVARSATLPKLSANGFATSGNKSSMIGSAPMVDPPSPMVVPPGTFLVGNVALMIPLIAPSLQAGADEAAWQATAAAGDLAEARADLTLQVTEAYDRVLLNRQLVLAEEAKVEAAQELVRTTKALFEAGKGIEASVDRTQAELSRAQRTLTSAKNEEAKALLDLQAAMGADMAKPLDPSDDLRSSPVALELADFMAQGKQSRGVLIAARARRDSASSAIRAAEGQRLPQVYGAVMGDAANRQDMGGLTAGLFLSFPLYDGGRINGEVAQARSMKSKAEAEIRQAELTVERQIRQAWLDVQTAQANATSAEAAVKAAESAYDVTALRVGAGKSILVEQLDALEALTRARADLAQAMFDQSVAIANLHSAAGGE